jgi:UDPglucose 6-dehydrogenase
MNNARAILPPGPQIAFAADALSAAQNADALLVLTEWPEFAALDPARLKAALRRPIVVDGRNLFDPQRMARHGFTCLSVGRPALQPPLETPAPALR